MTKTPFPWLTVEVALYGIILAMALALRVGGLGLWVMDVPEAEQAWQAWQLAHGQAPSGDYSPLLLSGQALLFFLLGGGDGVARLFPALAGSALVLLPALLRSRLGRAGALISALALAISPTLVFVSRYGNGASLLVTGMLGALCFWLAYEEKQRPILLYGAAVAAACALSADPRVVGVLLALAIAWVVARRGENPFSRAGADTWKRVAFAFGATFVLGTTALTFNLGGLGTWADFVLAWSKHLQPVVNGQPWYYPLAALLMYEPLSLVFGIIGGVDVTLRRERLVTLVWAASLLLILALVAGGRDAGDVALFCAPLTLLSGRAFENLVAGWRQATQPRDDALLSLGFLAACSYSALTAAFYAYALYYVPDQAATFLWLWLASLAALFVIVGGGVIWRGLEFVWRVAGATLAVVFLASSFSGATALNFRHVNDPRELHVHVTSDGGVRDMLKVMDNLSFHYWRSSVAMPVTVEANLGPVLRWYLRDREHVTFVDKVNDYVATPLVITQARNANPPLNEVYRGQDFVMRTWWDHTMLLDNDQPRWWLYRISIQRPVAVQRAILWVLDDEERISVQESK